jgi:uncharacterized protein (UPF0332 family)
MNAEEFIVFAGKTAVMGRAGARTAVSRAYYGAFHFAIAMLDGVATSPPCNGKAHTLVPLFLRCANHPDGNKAGYLLSDLHHERIKADYSVSDQRYESAEYAKSGVETATEIQKYVLAFEAACKASAEVRNALKVGILKLKASYKF